MIPGSQLRAQWSQLFAPADRTLPAMLTRQAERFTQKPLVTAADTTWTYAETHEAVSRCAGTLRSVGISQAIASPSSARTGSNFWNLCSAALGSALLQFRSTSRRADRSFSTSYQIALRGFW